MYIFINILKLKKLKNIDLSEFNSSSVIDILKSKKLYNMYNLKNIQKRKFIHNIKKIHNVACISKFILFYAKYIYLYHFIILLLCNIFFFIKIF